MVNPKSMEPECFSGEKSAQTQWGQWSFQFRKYVGLWDPDAATAMEDVETAAHPITETDLPGYNVTERADRQLGNLLVNRTSGPAFDIVTGEDGGVIGAGAGNAACPLAPSTAAEHARAR